MNYHLSTAYHELLPDKKKSLLARGQQPSINGNMLINGDNLLALKALMPTYAGKINCVYIDPPYNTGNEGWCYNDRVNNAMMKEWLGKAVDRDDLTRHDKWCCMMVPRLALLRELLAEDGVIFISIDDNEQHRLRMLMDEIFGEDNFVGNIVWRKKAGGGQDSEYLAREHEYILAYCKSRQFKISYRTRIILETEYKKVKNGRKCSYVKLEKWGSNALRTDRPTMYYAIKDPDGNDFYPQAPNGEEGNWRTKPAALDSEHIHWEWNKKKNRWTPSEVKYFDEIDQDTTIKERTIFYDLATTTDATEEQVEIFGSKRFDNSKPVLLIHRLVKISTSSDAKSIVLDSFAGSGTTAQAVLELNKEDGGSRRFILVECEDYADTVTAERIRRVCKGIPAAKDVNLKNGLGGEFSYWKLGEAMELKSILQASALPSYEDLAAYLFFTTTGETWNPRKMRKKQRFIGETDRHEIYLFYENSVEYLKQHPLTLALADTLPPATGKWRIVFAPARHIKPEELQSRRIKFCQLPYEIYRTAEKG